MIARRLILGLRHAAEFAAEWCGECCRAAAGAVGDWFELRWIRIRDSPAAEAIGAAAARAREALGWRWIRFSSWCAHRADTAGRKITTVVAPAWRAACSALRSAGDTVVGWSARASAAHTGGPAMGERLSSVSDALRALPARIADRVLKNRTATARAALALVFAAACIAAAAYFTLRNPAPQFDERHTQSSAWIQQLAGTR